MDSEETRHSESTAGRRNDVISAVANALDLLTLFVEAPTITVGSATRRLSLSRSTVHRLLNTLVTYGYVVHDPMIHAYRPGPVLTSVGLAAANSGGLRSVAQGALVALAARTGETAHLTLLRGAEVICIDSIESVQTVRTGSRVGWALPAHATAAGRALLAELSDTEITSIYPDEMIERIGQSQAMRRVDLLAELELVRARQYATNLGESEPDVSAVAVVLRDAQNRAQAALSVTAPRSRGDNEWMREAGQAALAVASEFGHRGR